MRASRKLNPISERTISGYVILVAGLKTLGQRERTTTIVLELR